MLGHLLGMLEMLADHAETGASARRGGPGGRRQRGMPAPGRAHGAAGRRARRLVARRADPRRCTRPRHGRWPAGARRRPKQRATPFPTDLPGEADWTARLPARRRSTPATRGCTGSTCRRATGQPTWCSPPTTTGASSSDVVADWASPARTAVQPAARPGRPVGASPSATADPRSSSTPSSSAASCPVATPATACSPPASPSSPSPPSRASCRRLAHAHIRIGTDVTVLNDHSEIPGLGYLPINAFVLHAREPVVVDTGLSLPDRHFVDDLGSGAWIPPTCAGSGSPTPTATTPAGCSTCSTPHPTPG